LESASAAEEIKSRVLHRDEMKKIYIPRNKEAQNILVAGAPGTRKSSLLRSLAAQAMERRWPVIFTDLKREYVAEFYRPDIDFLFNIGDDRCFNWRLDLEFADELGARSLAAFLIPHEEGSSAFFQKNARNILTFLFCIRETSHQRDHYCYFVSRKARKAIGRIEIRAPDVCWWRYQKRRHWQFELCA
jgi:hypothetical protein